MSIKFFDSNFIRREVETHGYTIIGLGTIQEYTVPHYDGTPTKIHYAPYTGVIYIDDDVLHADSDTVFVCATAHQMTPQEAADAIAEVMDKEVAEGRFLDAYIQPRFYSRDDLAKEDFATIADAYVESQIYMIGQQQVIAKARDFAQNAAEIKFGPVDDVEDGAIISDYIEQLATEIKKAANVIAMEDETDDLC